VERTSQARSRWYLRGLFAITSVLFGISHSTKRGHFLCFVLQWRNERYGESSTNAGIVVVLMNQKSRHRGRSPLVRQRSGQKPLQAPASSCWHREINATLRVFVLSLLLRLNFPIRRGVRVGPVLSPGNVITRSSITERSAAVNISPLPLHLSTSPIIPAIINLLYQATLPAQLGSG
jgi:hypothetical protein